MMQPEIHSSKRKEPQITPRHRLRGRGRGRQYLLHPEQVHPLIRIAHCARGQVSVRGRDIVDHELILVLKGTGKVRLGSICSAVSPGSLILIRPFVNHDFEIGSVDVVEHLAIHFDLKPDLPPTRGDAAERLPYRVNFPGEMDLPVLHQLAPGHRLIGELKQVVASFSDEQSFSKLAASSRLALVLAFLMERHEALSCHAGKGRDVEDQALGLGLPGVERGPGPGWRHRRKLQRAVALIGARYAEPLHTAHLAEAADLSVPHFNRLFKQWTGYSPMAYLRHFRIDAAKRLMRNPDLSIKQIAGSVGFENQYHFSRVFRQVDGVSPSAFRQALDVFTPA